MSVRCELKTLLIACVKLRSPLKIPISRSSCWFSNSHGSRTMLHLEASKELRRRPKTFNEADTQLINELVPNSTTGLTCPSTCTRSPSCCQHFVPRKETPRANGQLCASAAFKEADQRVTLKTQGVLFGDFPGQNCVFFFFFNIRFDKPDEDWSGSFEKTIT